MAKVFISSTFVDMHAERDILTQVVFPELRERCRKLKVHLYEIDLRWGVTQAETESAKTLQICLDEIDRCRPFFIGMLGSRYGWVPEKYEVPDLPQFDWLQSFPAGRSVTELEFEYGALSAPTPGMFLFFGPFYSLFFFSKKQTKTFLPIFDVARAMFYLRDMSFMKDVPQEHHDSFVSQKHTPLVENLRGLLPNFHSGTCSSCF